MDNIDEIKQKIDIVSLISEYLSLKKTGRNFKTCCPFHTEKSPSFVVSPERQIWHCFGCNLGGDIFEFIEKIENIEFPEALRILSQKAGVKLEQIHYDSAGFKNKERLFQINHLASEYYHYLLLNHPSGKKALEYILGRGIKHKSLELFRIGYSPNSWEGVSKYLIKKGFGVDELETAGLIIRDPKRKSYYDRFRGRLIFTLKDHRGNVLGFAGRKVPKEGVEDKEAKYINSPETPIYIKGSVLYGLDLTKEAIRREGFAIVVEGEIDAISSFQIGISNIVAIKGSALTEGQLVLLKRYCDSLYLSLDADLAGDLAVRRGIELAEKLGFSLKVVQLMEGKDPNECIVRNPQNWHLSLKNAIPIYDFYLRSAFKKYDKEDADGKKKITQELLPIFAKIENLVVKDHYLKLLAREISVNIEILLQEEKRIKREDKFPQSTTNKQATRDTRDRREVLEENLIGMFLQSDKPEIWKNDLLKIQNYLKSEPIKKIAEKILLFIDKNRKWNITNFVKEIPAEYIFLIDKLFLLEFGEKSDEEKEREFKKIVKEIELLALKAYLGSLGKAIKEELVKEEISKLNLEFEKTALRIKELCGVL
jgi:DNA primase